jgi:NTP pyrophosphatase (non-canonical NTP hydrolase)
MANEKPLDLPGILERLRGFVRERDWEQFHTPKNLAMALAAETGELLEIFQWLTDAEARAVMGGKGLAVREELADIFVYLLRLADVLEVDLESAVDHKLARNAAKYPVELAKGSARKYTELMQEKKSD